MYSCFQIVKLNERFSTFFPNFKVERSKSNQGEKHAERHPYVSSILNRFACAPFEKGEGAMKEGKIGISFARKMVNVLRGKIKSSRRHIHKKMRAQNSEETKCVFDVVHLGRTFLHIFDTLVVPRSSRGG